MASLHTMLQQCEGLVRDEELNLRELSELKRDETKRHLAELHRHLRVAKKDGDHEKAAALHEEILLISRDLDSVLRQHEVADAIDIIANEFRNRGAVPHAIDAATLAEVMSHSHQRYDSVWLQPGGSSAAFEEAERVILDVKTSEVESALESHLPHDQAIRATQFIRKRAEKVIHSRASRIEEEENRRKYPFMGENI